MQLALDEPDSVGRIARHALPKMFWQLFCLDIICFANGRLVESIHFGGTCYEPLNAVIAFSGNYSTPEHFRPEFRPYAW